jgi:transcription initiation factor TFIID TATA-box-binding protein
MISVGTKSERQAAEELQMTMDFLGENGYASSAKLDFQTRNIVATADFGKSVNLEKLSETTKAIYEPEQFPGAILRFEKPFKTSLLIFASGRAVIAGLKSSSQIEQVIDQLKDIIEKSQ